MTIQQYSKTKWVAHETVVSATNMNKVEDGLATVTDGVNAVEKTANAAWNATTDLKGQVSDAASKAKDAKDAADKVKTAVDTLGNTVTENKTSVDKTTERVTAIEGKIGDIEKSNPDTKKIAEDIQSVKDAATKAQTTADDVTTRVTTVEETLKTTGDKAQEALDKASSSNGGSYDDSGIIKRLETVEKTAISNKQIKIPEMRINGDKDAISSGNKTVVKFQFNDGGQVIDGYARIKKSGDSSQWMPKNPFKFDIFRDEACRDPYVFKAKSTWNATNSYNSKADYIDFTHSRNLSAAKIAYELALNAPYKVGFNKGFNTDKKQWINPNQDRQNLIYGIGWDRLAKEGKATISFSFRDFGNDNDKDFSLEVDMPDPADATKTVTTTIANFKTVQFETTHFSATFDVPKEWNKAAQNIFLKGNLNSGGDLTDFMIVPGDKDVSFMTSIAPWFNAPALGQVQGFPVAVYINDEYYGLETLCQNTTPEFYGVTSDYDKGFGVFCKAMDDNARFKANTVGLDDDNTYGLVFGQMNDKNKKDWDDFRNFIINSSDTVFKGEIDQHLHLYQAIDLMLMAEVLNLRDIATKSLTFLSYSGGYFIPVPYDLDQIAQQSWSWWGQNATKRGGTFVGDNIGNLGIQYDEFPEIPNDNNLFARIAKNFPDEIKARYAYLRKTTFRMSNLLEPFKAFIDSVPSEIYDTDKAKWVDLPNKDINNYQFIQQAMAKRIRFIDQMNGYNAITV